MKKSTIFLLVSILCLFFTFSAAAHSGKTDSKGGHYDHSTGEYHYHHGYPPHNHYNGECPYEEIEREKEQKKQEQIEKRKENLAKREEIKNSWWAKLILIIFLGGMGAWLIACITCYAPAMFLKKYEDFLTETLSQIVFWIAFIILAVIILLF